MEYTASTEEQTKDIACTIAEQLKPGSVIAFSGDLGAGKTTFIKYLAESLGVDKDLVTSPTFSYLNLYENIAHFDLYRLSGTEDFFLLGFDEYLRAPYIVCIEWAERLDDEVLPEGTIFIEIETRVYKRFIRVKDGILR